MTSSAKLDLKLLRDLNHIKGQAIAVALVMACGLAMMIMTRSLIHSLESTRQEYYEANRFAQVFAHLKRAPNSIAKQVKEIDGVSAVEPGIAVQVTLDIPNLDQPASGQVCSLPDFGEPELNRLYLRAGQWLKPGSRGEVLVGEAFAEANNLKPGEEIAMLLNGKRQVFRIAGIVLSPAFIFESRPGAALPDNKTYGIFWMPYLEIAKAFDLDGAFNQIAMSLEPGANEMAVIKTLDRLLKPYGGQGGYGRADHPSHIRVSDEIRILNTISIGFPIVFLSVAAFMINSVLSRLIALQREQIAVLKAFGFSNFEIAFHYFKFALVMVFAGTALGILMGIALGHRLVVMYHLFFRFPELHFRLEKSALVAALAVCTGAAVVGVLSSLRRAAKLPPAEAMRPEPPANYRPSIIERTGIAHVLSHTFRIAVRNIERKPLQAFLTVFGLSLATAILIIPNAFRDSVAYVLDYQWDVVQRQDVRVGLVEPSSVSLRHLFEQFPSVTAVEPFRDVPVRIHFGNHNRLVSLQGLPRGGMHSRVITEASQQIPLPENGMIVSAKLGEVLGAKVGDDLMVEALDGKRLTRPVKITGFSADLTGLVGYMDMQAVNRLMQEGDIITGASFCFDANHESAFYRALKDTPRVGWVAVKSTLRANFRDTTAASINLIQTMYLIFATIVAFGVVYNNARISLAERARELATLRVIGFSRREVATVLITELVILAVVAVPFGLLLGSGFATAIIKAVNTETVRLPLVLTMHNYAFAVLIVAIASALSALIVLRKLNQLNLVGALKAPE
jgi:putative ABC transport system permease protein